jgi:hypothetical protein
MPSGDHTFFLGSRFNWVKLGGEPVFVLLLFGIFFSLYLALFQFPEIKLSSIAGETSYYRTSIRQLVSQVTQKSRKPQKHHRKKRKIKQKEKSECIKGENGAFNFQISFKRVVQRCCQVKTGWLSTDDVCSFCLNSACNSSFYSGF